MRRGVAAVLLCAFAGCGKKGDPQPPLRILPQPVTDLKIAQRGDRLELSYVAPRLATNGERLGVLEVEITRSQQEGDFDKTAQRQTRRVAPGEALSSVEELPPLGTTVRVAARALAKGRASPRTPIQTLVVQESPLTLTDFAAEVAPDGVSLRWVDPNPVPAPTPEPTATPTPPPTPAPSAPTGATPPASTAPPAAAATEGQTAPPAAPLARPSPSPTAPPTPKPPSRGYFVYRRAKTGEYLRPLQAQPLTVPLFLDKSTQPGEEWCYVVRFAAATDPLLESPASNEACVAFKDIAAPAAPIGVAVVLRPDGVEVSWSPSPESDLAGYRVYRAAPPGAPPQKVGGVAAKDTSWRDTTAQAGVVNVYTVTALDAAGNESPPSRPVQVRP